MVAVCEAFGKTLSQVPMTLREKNAILKNDLTTEEIAIVILALLEDYWINTSGMEQVGLVTILGHIDRICQNEIEMVGIRLSLTTEEFCKEISSANVLSIAP